uniref:Reverse transcriptase domain-containing protein n=1 Tax=Heterorhabditis bacteriophora TaxID=37862 RepID=A0A1I7WGH7_HETBA
MRTSGRAVYKQALSSLRQFKAGVSGLCFYLFLCFSYYFVINSRCICLITQTYKQDPRGRTNNNTQPHVELLYQRRSTYRRLANLIDSLKDKPEQYWYPKILGAYIDEGIIELADEIIPQRGSLEARESYSFKDCSSFINKIHEILIGKIMITAAFVQIQLPEEDKDLTRFLWVKNRKTRRSVKYSLGTDFISNYKEFNDKIPEYDKAKGGELKVLGINYNNETDMFKGEVQFPRPTTLTKRFVISQIHGVYDPIGTVAPLLVNHKLFLRELFFKPLKSDESLSEELREYTRNNTYGCLSGKLKVTPIKRNVTISRLDLIEIIQIYIVGSNKAALSRLISSRSLPVFMGNQVKRIMNIREELLKLTKSVTFHYTPSELNPSDTGTRGCRGSKLSSSLWVNSPPIDHTTEMRATTIFPTKKVGRFGKLIIIGPYVLLFIKVSHQVDNGLRHCIICKRMNALPFERVIRANPFEHNGIGFLGPFECKEKDKVYVCLVCRESIGRGVLKCLQRFVARRRLPKTISRILSLNNEQEDQTGISINSHMSNQRIKWIFNPPNSPWMEGVIVSNKRTKK